MFFHNRDTDSSRHKYAVATMFNTVVQPAYSVEVYEDLAGQGGIRLPLARYLVSRFLDNPDGIDELSRDAQVGEVFGGEDYVLRRLTARESKDIGAQASMPMLSEKKNHLEVRQFYLQPPTK